MKHFFRIILLVVLILPVTQSKGQYILSLTNSPTVPTTNDTVTIFASCAFPSAGCDVFNQGSFVNGNTINAYALHCIGILTVICYATDTFKIPPLPAGNYSFIFQLDAGLAPAPCTPGIVPGPSDTLHFTVISASGIPENEANNLFSVYPNPAYDVIHIRSNEKSLASGQLELFSVEGKKIFTTTLIHPEESVPVHQLQNGFYLLKLTTRDGFEYWQEFIKH